MNFPELPSLESIREDGASARAKAVDFAKEKLVEPMARALRNSRDRFTDGVDDARHALISQRDRSADWIRANPLTAIGLALGAGALLAALRRKR